MDIEKLISGVSDEVRLFINEWFDEKAFVTAHTSGSTGTPKEIHLLKSDMRISAKATLMFFGINCNSHLHLPLSPDYIAGKMQIVRALEAKCRLSAEEPSNRPLSESFDNRISLLPIVPSQAEAILENPVRCLIDNLIIGGAPLTPQLEKRIISSGLHAFATYGMTETCSHVALRPLGSEHFKALPGFTFSTDERGCLVINSSSMSFGTLTTNDIVRLHNPKEFTWIGRHDNIINSGGMKISPEEIENAIAQLMPDTIGEYYITSRASSRWGEEAVLVCSSTPPDGFLERLQSVLGHIKAPKAIIVDTEIQHTASKKIIRRKFQAS